MGQPIRVEDLRTGRSYLVDSETGEYVNKDQFVPVFPPPTGFLTPNPTDENAPHFPPRASKYPAQNEFGVQTQESEPDFTSKAYKYLSQPGRILADIGPTGAGLLTGLLSRNPALGTEVNVVGQALANAGRARYPEIFGDLDEDIQSKTGFVWDAAQEAGPDVAAWAGGKIIKNIAPGQLRQRWVRRRYPIDPALNKSDFTTPFTTPTGEELPLTVGDLNPRARELQETYGREKFGQRIREGQEAFSRQIRPDLQEIGPLVEQGQQQGLDIINQLETDRFTNRAAFKAHVKANKVNKPYQYVKKMPDGSEKLVTTRAGITGPIDVRATHVFANRELNRIKSLLRPNAVSPVDLSKVSGKELKKLRGYVEELAQIRKPMDGSNPVQALEKLELTRDSIMGQLNKLGLPETSEFGRGIKSLVDVLDKDIDTSIKGWGTQAYTAYRRHKDSVIDLTKKIDEMKASRLLRSGSSPSMVLSELGKDALTAPERMAAFVKNAGDTNKTLSTQIFKSELARNAYEAEGDIFSARKGLEWFTELKNSGVAKEALSPADLVNTEAMLRFAQHNRNMGPGLDKALNLNNVRSAATGLALGTEAIFSGTILKSGAVRALYSGYLTLSAATRRKIMVNALNDPKYAKIVMGTQGIDKPGKLAQNTAKLLLHGARGGHVIWHGMNGEKAILEINDEGKLDFPKPSSPDVAETPEPE